MTTTYARLQPGHEDRGRLAGSSLVGYVDAPFRHLVDRLGEPDPGDGCSVAAEWVLAFPDGTIASVYDYDHEATRNPETITNWHVGGHGPEALDRVVQVLGVAGRRLAGPGSWKG